MTERFELSPFRIGALIQRLGPTRPCHLEQCFTDSKLNKTVILIIFVYFKLIFF